MVYKHGHEQPKGLDYNTKIPETNIKMTGPYQGDTLGSIHHESDILLDDIRGFERSRFVSESPEKSQKWLFITRGFSCIKNRSNKQVNAALKHCIYFYEI